MTLGRVVRSRLRLRGSVMFWPGLVRFGDVERITRLLWTLMLSRTERRWFSEFRMVGYRALGSFVGLSRGEGHLRRVAFFGHFRGSQD